MYRAWLYSTAQFSIIWTILDTKNMVRPAHWYHSTIVSLFGNLEL